MVPGPICGLLVPIVIYIKANIVPHPHQPRLPTIAEGRGYITRETMFNYATKKSQR